MDLGEAGYNEFKKSIKQKQVARQMADDQPELFAGISPEKAQKMISKAVEAQEKSDAAARRARVLANTRPHQNRHASASKKQNRSRTPAARKPARNTRKDRAYYSPQYRRPDNRDSSSKYSPRKRGSNNHRP